MASRSTSKSSAERSDGEPSVVYRAVMPGVFGYGLESFSWDKRAAIMLLTAEYYKWRRRAGIAKGQLSWWTFKEACQDFAATVTRIQMPDVGAEGQVGDSEEIFNESD